MRVHNKKHKKTRKHTTTTTKKHKRHTKAKYGLRKSLRTPKKRGKEARAAVFTCGNARRKSRVRQMWCFFVRLLVCVLFLLCFFSFLQSICSADEQKKYLRVSCDEASRLESPKVENIRTTTVTDSQHKIHKTKQNKTKQKRPFKSHSRLPTRVKSAQANAGTFGNLGAPALSSRDFPQAKLHTQQWPQHFQLCTLHRAASVENSAKHRHTHTYIYYDIFFDLVMIHTHTHTHTA